MVEVRLFGSLRRFAENSSVMTESIAWVTPESGDTVAEVLRQLEIDLEQEVGNVFVNGRYSYTAGEMPVQNGDRLGVFPKNMAMLYC
jgi:molybdopterin converting factor small subunit